MWVMLARSDWYVPTPACFQVMIWDDHQVKCIGELSFRSQVQAVKEHTSRTWYPAAALQVAAAAATLVSLQSSYPAAVEGCIYP